MDEKFIVTIDQYINLLHRMTNYSEEVIEKYITKFDMKHLGDITMRDIYNDDTMTKLYWIEKRIKIQKLINLSK